MAQTINIIQLVVTVLTLIGLLVGGVKLFVKLGMLYQQINTMGDDMASVKKKLWNGLSNDVTQLKQQVSDLPCKVSGECP